MTSLLKLDPNSDEPRLDAESVRLVRQLTPVQRLEARLILAERMQAPREASRLSAWLKTNDPTRKA